MALVVTKQTTSAYDKRYPKLYVVDANIYYIYHEYDGAKYQLWTAIANLAGSSFTPTKQTTTAQDKTPVGIQVVGATIYYLWRESDGSYYQIWIATSGLDGSSFTPVKVTTDGVSKSDIQFQVVGSVIYYTYRQSDGSYNQIHTATSNLSGTGFATTEQTNTSYHKYEPQLKVVGTAIYYVWREYDGAKYQIWTAISNLTGSVFTPTKQTTSAYNKRIPQLYVLGSCIYYIWREQWAKEQLCTAYSNLDGTGFTATKQTDSAYNKYSPQLQVVSSTIQYIWVEEDSGWLRQVWTATSSLNGSNFTPTKQTTSAFGKYSPQFQAVVTDIYYVWYETDGDSYEQIWTARTAASPTVTSQAVSVIKVTTATGNGNVTDDGGATVTERGVCWNTTGSPTTADDKAAADVGGTGAFTAAMTDLVIATKHYVKAYAINSEGTSYGAQVDFTTLGKVYPSDAITRVTSLTHRYDRGTYTLEVGLGEVTADFGLPEWDSKPKPAIPEKPEIPEPYPDVIPWPEPIPPIEPPPKTQPWFPDVVPWPEEDPFAVDTTGATPEHRGGLVGGLGSLRGGRVGLSGGGISGYRRRKLIQEAIERNERAAKRAARLGRESAGIAPPKPAFGGGIVGGISPIKKKKPPVESYRKYFEGF